MGMLWDIEVDLTTTRAVLLFALDPVFLQHDLIMQFRANPNPAILLISIYFSGIDFLENLLTNSLESAFDVHAFSCRAFHEQQPASSGEGFAFLFRYNSLVSDIAFIPNQQNNNILIAVESSLLLPTFDALETVSTGNIVNQ